MKTTKLSLIIIISLILMACGKTSVSDEGLSAEDQQHYEAMQQYFQLAEDYEMSLENCKDSIITGCDQNYLDSMYHDCIRQWEHHHDMYSHQNSSDDHHHQMMGDSHHNHCQHCENHYHSIEEHHSLDSLENVHRNLIH